MFARFKKNIDKEILDVIIKILPNVCARKHVHELILTGAYNLIVQLIDMVSPPISKISSEASTK